MIDRMYSTLITNAVNQNPRQTRNALARSYFGHHMVVDSLAKGYFPALLGRKLFLNGIIGELAAFLDEPGSVKEFQQHGCNYWNDFGDEHGMLNLDYGNAWRNFGGVDQLDAVVESLKADPHGRRHLITGWNPVRLPELTLPCCHYSYQWYVNDRSELEMIWNQRSVDIMVGLPSDIILAAVWNILMAQTVGLKPGRLHFMLGDCHVYESHLEGVDQYLAQAAEVQLDRPRPTWTLDEDATVFNFEPSMLQVVNYQPSMPIKFKLEV